MKNKTTQRSEVLRYLRENGSITSTEAFKLFGATRLAAIIFDLRKLGYKIETFLVEGTTRYGTAVQYAKYIYRGE